MLLFASFCVVSIPYLVYGQSQYPVYKGSGSHYDVGFAIGSQAKQRIQDYVNNYPPLQQLRFCLLTACSVQFRELVQYNQQIWPQYFQELDGIADGADVDSSNLYLLSFKHEVLALQNQVSAATKNEIRSELLECSDILLNNASFEGFGHNEDGWNGTVDYAYFAHYNITNGTENEFFAFQYPASLVGHAFGVNKYGLSVSMNAVFPTNVTVPARGCYFVVRAVMDAHNISEAIEIIKNQSADGIVSAYGASINIGYMNENKQIMIANVEMANNVVSVQNYGTSDSQDEAYGYHFNMYLRLNVSQQNETSSVERLERTTQLIAQNGLSTAKDIVNILGDTQNTQYPIYRDATPPDDSATLATAIFDLENHIMSVYEKCNPKSCAPSFNFSFHA